MTIIKFSKILFLLFLCINLSSQNPYLGSFDPHANTSGLPYFDRGGIILESDGFLYIGSAYLDVLINGYPRAGHLFKFDLSENKIVKQIEIMGPQGDRIDVNGIVSKEGAIYLAGEWGNFEQARKKMSLAKYDSDLELEWITYFTELDDPNFSFFCFDICTAHNGDILMPVIIRDHVNNKSTLWMLRVDLNGNVIYFKQIPTTLPTITTGGNITKSVDGTYMLTSPAKGRYEDFTHTYLQVHRLDEDANVIWTDTHLGDRLDYWQLPYSSTDESGNTTVIWTRDSFFLYLDTIFVPSYTRLINFDPDGEIRWDYPWFMAVRGCYLSDLHPAKNGDILGSGIWDDVAGTQYIHGWAFRINQEGEMLWSRQYADTTTQFVFDRSWQPFFIVQMTELEDKRIAMTGWRLEYTDIPEPGSVNGNVLLMITDSLGCLTPGCDDDVQYLTSARDLIPISKVEVRQLDIFPNPASNEVYLQRLNLVGIAQKNNLRLDAYDLSGKKIWGSIWNGEELQLNISSWPTGKVVIHCTSNGLPLATGSIIKINE